MDLYRDIILDHYKHPRNFGHLKKPDAASESANVNCGDRVKMEIKISHDKKHIKDIRFFSSGCAISTASASMLTDMVKGRTIDSVAVLTVDNILELIGMQLSYTRLRCALLPLEALQNAIRNNK